MAIIYGVDPEQPYSAEDVKNALVRCFIDAHREAQERELDIIIKDMNEGARDKLTSANIQIIVKKRV